MPNNEREQTLKEAIEAVLSGWVNNIDAVRMDKRIESLRAIVQRIDVPASRRDEGECRMTHGGHYCETHKSWSIPLPAEQRETCVWTWLPEESWSVSCYEGGCYPFPIDDNVVFCPYCGKRIMEATNDTLCVK